MLVQTSSPLHHCLSGSTNSLPPGVLQPETYPPSERPVKHPSRNPHQHVFWNFLHLHLYWGLGNCCKPANAPSRRPWRPTGRSTTNSYIAQPETAYASAGHGHRWTPQPRPVYWSPGNYCTLRQRPVPVDNRPHRTTGAYLSTSTRPIFIYPCRRLYLYPRTRHATDSVAFHTYGSASNPQTDAPDPHLTHGRYIGVRSAAAPFTAAAFQLQNHSFRSPSIYSRRFPTAPNAPSPTISTVMNAARKFSDNNSQAFSSATPNNSTQLSDVPHQDDWNCDTRKSPTNSSHLPVNPPGDPAY